MRVLRTAARASKDLMSRSKKANASNSTAKSFFSISANIVTKNETKLNCAEVSALYLWVKLLKKETQRELVQLLHE